MPTVDATLRTLEKGLLVLEELSASGRQGIATAELGRRLGLHRTTLNRFLATLTLHGYAEQSEDNEHYRLGLKALSLASASIAGLTLRDIGGPVLEDLQQATRETVQIVVLDHGDVVTIDRLEAEHPLGLRTHVGSRRPAYCSAAGKAMLAYLPESAVDAILARGMPRRTERTLTDPRALKLHLHEVRSRGYALDDEESVEGIGCVAAPVFDISGRVVGAVSLAAPVLRVGHEQLCDLSLPVVEAARRLSRQLGYWPVGGQGGK